MTKLTRKVALMVALSTLVVTSANALTETEVQAVKKAVVSVPAPEMAAKAAQLVSNASKKDRQAVAIAAVRAILSKNANAATAVVAAIAKIAPDLAATVAVVATELAADQAAAIAKAAASAAPGEAADIAAAVSAVTPNLAAQVSQSVTSVVPGSATQITEAVNTRLSAHTTAASSGTVTVGNNPINTVNRTGPGGNAFLPNNQPPAGTNPGPLPYGNRTP